MIRLLLVLLLAGCAQKKAPAGAREIVDGAGRKLRLGEVRRVVSLAPSSTEILFAVGAGPLVVGVDRYSDWPPETKKLERVGADIDPSLERIIGLRPDLVLTATSANTQSTVDALERLGVPVMVSQVATLDDVYRDVENIGRAVGRGAEAARVVEGMRARIGAVAEKLRGEPPARALVVVWTGPLIVAGGRSHLSQLLQAAGGVNVAEDSPQQFPTYSLERLVEHAPEVLVVGTHADVTPPLEPLLALKSVPAVRDHRIQMVDGDLLFRPGPRLVEGAEALGRALHPRRFSDAHGDGAAP